MASVDLGGTAYAKIDGTQVALRGSLKINTGGPVRTPVMGMDGTLQGYTTKYEAPKCSFEISDDGTLTLGSLRQLTNTTITMQLANGRTVIIPNGFQTEDIELDAVEGKFVFTASGPTMQELLGAAT
jgi:hypothetical protein